MTIKLHLHSGYDVPKLGITADMELGHLYDDAGDLDALHATASRVGLSRRWFQDSQTGLPHYDLWNYPLKKAKELFQIVSDDEMVADLMAYTKSRENPSAATKTRKEQ